MTESSTTWNNPLLLGRVTSKPNKDVAGVEPVERRIVDTGKMKRNQDVFMQYVITARVDFGGHLPCVKREIDCGHAGFWRGVCHHIGIVERRPVAEVVDYRSVVANERELVHENMLCHLPSHNISCREPSVQATPDPLATADTPS